ncbi:MAG TPA: hypothetical protein VHZ26_13550 [Caulobacteraceae bacterium]|nr:hypothetical protein [Caulobacteraceae bacterium]
MPTEHFLCPDCEVPLLGENQPDAKSDLLCPVCGKAVPFEVAVDELQKRLGATYLKNIEGLF